MSGKAERLLTALGEVDEKYVEMSQPKINVTARKKLNVPRWLPAAACTLLAAGMGFGACKISDEIKRAKLGKYHNLVVNSGESRLLTWTTATSIACMSPVDYAEIPEKYIGEFLRREEIDLFITNDEEMRKKVEAEVFAVKGISTDCAVAVRLEGQSVFRPMGISVYRCNRLRELVEGFNLIEYGTLSALIQYSDTAFRFYKQPDKHLLEMLFSEPDIPDMTEQAESFKRSDNYFTISVGLPVLGMSDFGREEGGRAMNLEFGDNGYLRIYGSQGNIMGTFDLGREKAAAIFEYIGENCTVYFERTFDSSHNAPDTSEYDISDGKLSPGYDPYA